MAPVRNRKTNKEKEGTVYMDESLTLKVQEAMFEHDLKFSELARKSLSHYIDNVLPTLYQRKQSITRGNLPVNEGNLPVKTSNNGLVTPEELAQIAQILNMMRGSR